jgi:hypothetical protein
VGRPGGNVFSDRQGNVYQRSQSTNQWQQRSPNNSWRPVQNQGTTQNLNRQQQMFNRGQVRSQNFQQARSFSAPSRPSGGGGFSRPSGGGGGGGSRPSGGGGGGRRH